jgi:hypothetical protein
MLEILIIAGVIVFIIVILMMPTSKKRSFDPRAARQAEARTSMVFLTDDRSRAEEYEHRFSASRTGMHMDPSGYTTKKRKR